MGCYNRYAKGQSTLEDLSNDLNCSIRTLQTRFDKLLVVTGDRTPDAQAPLAIVITLDATFFGDRGLLLARSNDKRNLHWKEIRTETVAAYEEVVSALSFIGYEASAFVIDGRRGVRQKLQTLRPETPIQYCQFHQIQTVKKHIPQKAQSEAARSLRQLTLRLKKELSVSFSTALRVWYVLYQNFLKERTYRHDPDRKRTWRYTHQRLRSAYRSIKTNLPYLFTYQLYPELNIPNTTNHCDGFFAHLKERIKRHRRLCSHRKWKMIHFLLENWD